MKPCKHTNYVQSCRVCHLAATHPGYQALWELTPPPRKIILTTRLPPGDGICILACIESLHRQFPKRYVTDLRCCVREAITANHPLITRLHESEAEVIEMHCPGVHRSHIQRHFMSTWTDWLAEKLGIPLQLQVSRPTLYLSREEQALPRLQGHWVGNFGFKYDCEAKWFGRRNWQRVVDALPETNFIQIGENHPDHSHPRLTGANVIDMVGRTTARQLIQLVSQCDGAIGGVTFLQHIAAALGKPYVCVNTREPRWYTDYPLQTTFSPAGKIRCHMERACWASRVTEKGRGANKCQLPLIQDGEATGSCVNLICPESVAAAVRSYNASLCGTA